jgi:hypothetical protein
VYVSASSLDCRTLYIKTVNKSLKIVADFKYLGLTNKNYIHEDMKQCLPVLCGCEI